MSDKKSPLDWEIKCLSANKVVIIPIDKVVLTFTNLFAILPFIGALTKGRFDAAVVIFLSGLFSFLHHSVEERYDMPSLIKVNSWLKRQIMLNCDQMGAFAAMVFFFSWKLVSLYCPVIIFLLCLMLLSEVVCLVPGVSQNNRRLLRLVLHSLWHVGAFTMAFIAITS